MNNDKNNILYRRPADLIRIIVILKRCAVGTGSMIVTKITNMKRAIYILSFIILSLTLGSCQQRLYFPDRANTPGLIEPMEGKAALSFKPQANGTDSLDYMGSPVSIAGDLAFSPVNHLGLIASYRSTINRIVEEDNAFWVNGDQLGSIYNGHRLEIGAGYYDVIGHRGKVEVYAGYGNGRLQREGKLTPELDFRIRYHRFFVQPAIGFGNDKISFTGGFRIAIHKFYDFRSYDPTLKYHIGREPQDVTSVLYPFWEPFVNFEVGHPYLKFNVQTGLSKQLAGSHITGNAPFFISFGLVGHFAPRFLKNAPSKDRL